MQMPRQTPATGTYCKTRPHHGGVAHTGRCWGVGMHWSAPSNGRLSGIISRFWSPALPLPLPQYPSGKVDVGPANSQGVNIHHSSRLVSLDPAQPQGPILAPLPHPWSDRHGIAWLPRPHPRSAWRSGQQGRGTPARVPLLVRRRARAIAARMPSKAKPSQRYLKFQPPRAACSSFWVGYPRTALVPPVLRST